MRRPLGVVELATGGMLLSVAAGGMVGPVTAAVLVYRNGGAGEGVAAPLSVILAVVGVVIIVISAVALFVMAWRRDRRRTTFARTYGSRRDDLRGSAYSPVPATPGFGGRIVPRNPGAAVGGTR